MIRLHIHTGSWGGGNGRSTIWFLWCDVPNLFLTCWDGEDDLMERADFRPATYANG